MNAKDGKQLSTFLSQETNHSSGRILLYFQIPRLGFRLEFQLMVTCSGVPSERVPQDKLYTKSPVNIVADPGK